MTPNKPIKNPLETITQSSSGKKKPTKHAPQCACQICSELMNSDPFGRHSSGQQAGLPCKCARHEHAHTCEEGEHEEEEHEGHHHEHEHDTGFSPKKDIFRVILAAVLIAPILLAHEYVHSHTVLEFGLFLPAYVVVGYPIFRELPKSLREGHFLDENFLMSIATIGTIITHNLPEAVAVLIFYQIGESLETLSLTRSRQNIKGLLDVRPQSAMVRIGDILQEVHPEAVQVGQQVVIRLGEKVPVDGVITEGASFFDTSPLTGESVPRNYKEGDEIMAGIINTGHKIEMKATKPFADSSIMKIFKLIEEAEVNKAPTERFISKFARVYTPIVVLIGIFIAIVPPLVTGQSYYTWLYRAMIFFIISCPCALVISIPLGYFGGIGAASRQGILVKGASYLDLLGKTKTMVFDKTGTITKGNFRVVKVVPVNGLSKEKLLYVAAHAEFFSNHPIAQSILTTYGAACDDTKIDDFCEVPAKGITVTFEESSVIMGNDAMLHTQNICHDEKYCTLEGTIVHISIKGKYEGYIEIADEIKEGTLDTLDILRKFGVKQLVMLSGDNQQIVNRVAQPLGFDQYYGNLLPEEKVAKIKQLEMQGGTVAFIGDGVNDAPVIAQADLGIAMGGIGSDAAIESANIVLMNDKLDLLPKGIQISRKTTAIVWQNIAMAFIVKLLFMVLGIFGVATIWEAVFADVGMAIIAILNAQRLLKFTPKLVKS